MFFFLYLLGRLRLAIICTSSGKVRFSISVEQTKKSITVREQQEWVDHQNYGHNSGSFSLNTPLTFKIEEWARI